MFSLKQERHSDILVLHYSGDMTFSETLSLRSTLERLLGNADKCDIVLDLLSLQRVNASGVGALVSAYTLARTYGKRILLYRCPPHFSELLSRIGIAGFFPSLEEEDDLYWRISRAERCRQLPR